MLGAIIGDVIGSVFEWHSVKSEDFTLFSNESSFTDDSILTAATANAIPQMLQARAGLGAKRYCARLYASQYKPYGSRFPGRGYGERKRITRRFPRISGMPQCPGWTPACAN